MRGKTTALLGFLLATGLVAALASAATATSVGTWYTTLAKPGWTPPSWLFGPVWTALYLAMAVAAWLVWMRRKPGRRAALLLFAVQLLLNGGWSWLFFVGRAPGAALAEIVILWIALAATTAAFARVHTGAGWLMVPYLGWVSFAAALNFAIWTLN